VAAGGPPNAQGFQHYLCRYVASADCRRIEWRSELFRSGPEGVAVAKGDWTQFADAVRKARLHGRPHSQADE